MHIQSDLCNSNHYYLFSNTKKSKNYNQIFILSNMTWSQTEPILSLQIPEENIYFKILIKYLKSNIRVHLFKFKSQKKLHMHVFAYALKFEL